MRHLIKLFAVLATATAVRPVYAEQCVEVRKGDTLKSLKRRAGIQVPNSTVVDGNLDMTWGVVRFTDKSGDAKRKHFAMSKVGGSAKLRAYANRYGKRRDWTLVSVKFGLRHDRGPNACMTLAIPANPCLAPLAHCTGEMRELQARKGVAPSQQLSQVAALTVERDTAVARAERVERDNSDLQAERGSAIRERNELKAKLVETQKAFENLSSQAVPAINKAAAQRDSAIRERDKLAGQLEAVRSERNQLADDLTHERAKVAELNSALAAAPAAQKRTADSGQRAEEIASLEHQLQEAREQERRSIDSGQRAVAVADRTTAMLERAKACHGDEGTRYDFDSHNCVAIASVAGPLSTRQMWALGIGVALVLSLMAHAGARERRGQRGLEKFALAFHQMRETLQALCGVEGNGHTQLVNGNGHEPTPERFDAIMRRIRAEAGRWKRMAEDATARLRIALASLEPDDEKRGELIAQYQGYEIDDLVTKAAEVLSAQAREIEELRAARPAPATQPVEAVEAEVEVTDDGALLAQMAELQQAHDALVEKRDSARQDVERLAKALAKAREDIHALTVERDGADTEVKFLRRQLERRPAVAIGPEVRERITREVEAALVQIAQSAEMKAAVARRGHAAQGVAALRRVTQELLSVVTPAAG